MDERKLKILQAIVHSYISFGEPIGSRTISKQYSLGVSPATIRNEMSDLEEMGLLVKTHTSSGRIPSELALRLYVDELLSFEAIAQAEREAIKNSVIKDYDEVEGLIRNGTKILSELTQYTSIALMPKFNTSKLSHIRLVPITSRRALLVIVDQKGLVDDTIIEFDKDIDESQLIILSNLLSSKLKNKTFREIVEDIQVLPDNLNSSDKYILSQISDRISKKNDSKLIYNGLSHLIDNQGNEDIEKIKSVLEFLDDRENLRSLLLRDQDSGLVIKIGSENCIEEMKNCSVITASYHMGKYNLGKIGIIGPTRLQYSRVIPLIKSIAYEISKWFEENDI